jgi:polysaccharide chain length determinant protein (PEP-CTERM system associated)
VKEASKFDILYYLEMGLRRKWWIILPGLLTIALGVAYILLAPKVYKATTLILVEPQVIPDSYVKATLPETVEKRLRTITEQVHSRTNLGGIINELDLRPRPPGVLLKSLEAAIEKALRLLRLQTGSDGGEQRPQTMSMQVMVEEVRQNLHVAVRGSERNQTFEISFEWHDPELAAKVANSVSTKFIKENLNTREEMAAATTDFLDNETTRIREELETVESMVEAFKRKHLGTLPSELDSNINIINQLREELNNLEKRQDTEKQAAMVLEQQLQIQKTRGSRAYLTPQSIPSDTGAPRERAEGSLDPEVLEAELQALSLRYTGRHPDIIALKNRIEVARLRKNRSSPFSPAGASPQTSPGAESDLQETYLLRMQMEAARSRIELCQQQAEQTRKDISVYKERVQRTPQVEIEMTKMLRDYQTVQQRYQSILSRKLDAKMSEELEKRHKGEQFRVLDPAVKPEKPFKPDSAKILYLSIVAGLALGCSLAYMREAFDPCVCGPEEIESFTGIDVIASLPDVGRDLPQANGSKREGTRFDFLRAGKLAGIRFSRR